MLLLEWRAAHSHASQISEKGMLSWPLRAQSRTIVITQPQDVIHDLEEKEIVNTGSWMQVLAGFDSPRGTECTPAERHAHAETFFVGNGFSNAV